MVRFRDRYGHNDPGVGDAGIDFTFDLTDLDLARMVMQRLPSCRFLLEAEPKPGWENMAIDAALLETAVADELATFRWYRWSEPTISFGYFQRESELSADPQLADLPRVRRLTGGGAILHDHEWTYSFVVPARQQLCQHPNELYDLVHAAIIELLRRHKFPVRLRGETRQQSPEPVLCFSRKDAHDVVWQDAKVLGSAQRRRKGAVLQHGSLLMAASDRTPQHPGLCTLGDQVALHRDELRSIPEQFTDRLFAAPLTPEEIQRVQRSPFAVPRDESPPSE